MPTPLTVGFDSRSGLWLLEPLVELQVDLHECDLIRISVETTSRAEGVALIDIRIPGVEKILRVHFETSSALLKLERLEDDTPVDAYTQIEGTDFAEPDWFLFQLYRGDLEMRSNRQYYEWLE